MAKYDKVSGYCRKPQPDTADITIERKCLVCGEMMASTPSHRIHERCRQRVGK
ncbi:MAG: hypothetical protein NTZ78_09395 [Candidatus Aureabacteria bacterium]|nr:hypothetical protein [Candidatus Auribacterota bacterium]